ncbi:dihydroneopterin aldolase [Lentibacillus cibarius]|uniref:7,8-dihydroneopterin aldolase n=1 Tax=Lentibacillus cibarius TaxID=2583219 RepID=A0A549YH17_9BACI|nr:dihydroneopterin aldolase [Lentibacillus cibarius]TRM11137.1 dihydroneopterin aldolase [Lentibacillus cibarius]
MDKILLNQLAFYGYHGLFQEEKKLGQRFYVDVELHADLKKAGRSDDMNDSIDYGAVYHVIKAVMEGKSINLLEALAETISIQLFQSFSLLDACLIRITKPDPPIPGHYQSVAAEIFRRRNE